MRLKSYFASTVEEAISLASCELGEDAMLVYSRETLPEARRLGRYEVVFALEAASGAGGAASESVAGGEAVAVAGSHGGEAVGPWRELRAGLRADLRTDLLTDLMDLKRQLARMERLLVHTTGAVAANRWSQAGEELFQELLAQELPADLAAAIVSSLERALPPGRSSDREAAVAELAAHIAMLPCGRGALRPGQTHVFVGPSGGGKTTMLVKLAVLLGMEKQLPVMLVSLDSRRIGGADQLKTFAHILGVPFSAVDHRSALDRLLETESRRQMVFLDTPGFSEEDLAEQSWLRAPMWGGADVQTHLVLPAYLRTKECARLIRRYQAFRPSSLMLTHVDESETVGGVLGEIMRCGLPLSYCGTGQSIPEDIRECEPEWLAQRVLPAAGETAAGVAGNGASWAVA